MELKIAPARQVQGQITVPGDKSISHRAAILGALAEGETIINNFLRAEDCLATLRCLRQLGVAIIEAKDSSGKNLITIKGRGLKGLKQPSGILDCGNSGTTFRLLLGVLTGQSFAATLTGDASLQKRPMARVTLPLTKMGASFWPGNKAEGAPFSTGEIYPLLTVKGGPVRPIEYILPVASAQVKSAILLAGLYANGRTHITEPAQSRDHTEKMLKVFGAEITSERTTVILTGPARLIGRKVIVPGDLSAAAFFIVAALLAHQGKLTIKNVGLNPTRTGLIEALQKMGARIELSHRQASGGEPSADLAISNSDLSAAQIGGDMIPRLIDEIPILAVAATQASGRTTISEARELRIKESDRLASLKSELTKMGAKIEEKPDGLIIDGPTPLTGTTVRSFGDHRITMALTIAALSAQGETTITEADNLATSFPDFLALLKNIAR